MGGGVVRHDVDQDSQAQSVDLLDQRPGIGQGAEDRIDGPVVGDVVASVDHRRGEPRVDPQSVHPQIDQVVQALVEPGEVPDAVTVSIGETAQVDLVADRVTPPVEGLGRRSVPGNAQDPPWRALASSICSHRPRMPRR